jgi:orotate phosphoribosyltransferase
MSGDLMSLLGARRGHFRFESGHHGELWLDLDLLFRRPARLLPYVCELAGLLEPYDAEVICGPLTGGAFVASLVAAESDARFCFAERTVAPRADALYSAEYQVAAGSWLAGARVAIVDDAINAGSAVGSTAASLQALGARPVVLGALLVLGESASELAVSLGAGLESVERAGNSLWSPDSCPACAAGIPLTS